MEVSAPVTSNLIKLKWKWDMWETMTPDGQQWALSLSRSPDEISFIALANYVQHCRGTISSGVMSAKEISEITMDILNSYPLFSPKSRGYIGVWISECCQELINTN
jgi:hypothetical protein